MKTYARLYDGFFLDEKFINLSMNARGLWVTCLSYSNLSGTDGALSMHAIRTLAAHSRNISRTLTELVDAGLFIKTDNGYKFNKWSPYQPTKSEIVDKANYDKERNLNKKKIENEGEFTALKINTKINTNINKEKYKKESSNTPSETQLTKPASPNGEDVVETKTVAILNQKEFEQFEQFWEVYPRKTGKGKGKEAFKKAVKKTSFEKILQGCIRFANDPNLPKGNDESFIPHPATWLNQERWSDGTLPKRPGKPTTFFEAKRENTKTALMNFLNEGNQPFSNPNFKSLEADSRNNPETLGQIFTKLKSIPASKEVS